MAAPRPPAAAARGRSHLLEKMGERTGDDQGLGMVAKADLGLVVEAAAYRGDVIDIDDGGAVDLPELGRVELDEELADGLPDERLRLAGHQPRVFVVRLEEENLLDRDQAHVRAHRGLDPAQVLGGAAAEARGEALDQVLDPRRARGEALLQPADGEPEPLLVEGLEHVVDCAALEGLDRVLVVGGDEDHVGPGADRARRLQAIDTRHVDVEEEELRAVVLEDLQHVAAVLHLAHDRELGPETREARAQLRAQQRLIVGNDGADATTVPYVRGYAVGGVRACPTHAAAPAGTSIEATTPWGARSSITRRAETP